mmetsp:Transcript_85772/g.265532  ORF Transcript_85772/g.265532 Transcript_85772/m.265532 type:complete len:346 (-) Transcript_85772:552-1589(-)
MAAVRAASPSGRVGRTCCRTTSPAARAARWVGGRQSRPLRRRLRPGQRPTRRCAGRTTSGTSRSGSGPSPPGPLSLLPSGPLPGVRLWPRSCRAASCPPARQLRPSSVASGLRCMPRPPRLPQPAPRQRQLAPPASAGSRLQRAQPPAQPGPRTGVPPSTADSWPFGTRPQLASAPRREVQRRRQPRRLAMRAPCGRPSASCELRRLLLRMPRARQSGSSTAASWPSSGFASCRSCGPCGSPPSSAWKRRRRSARRCDAVPSSCGRAWRRPPVLEPGPRLWRRALGASSANAGRCRAQPPRPAQVPGAPRPCRRLWRLHRSRTAGWPVRSATHVRPGMRWRAGSR